MDARTLRLAYRFLTRIVSLAAAELRRLQRLARRIGNSELRRQALASLRHKAFHVHGGCILATFLDNAAARSYVRLVAAYETAVDYLDNLCDRIGLGDEADFRTLHEALVDAFTPGALRRDYFRRRNTGDGGYLDSLVAQTQKSCTELPSFETVAPLVQAVTRQYCELQAVKHLAPGQRERRCAAQFGAVAPDLAWWEGAAACGSTMPTFALLYGATSKACSSRRARALHDAYYPYFSALHILLDYFVDQAEDRRHRELNFVACYPTPKAAQAGIVDVARHALDRLSALEDDQRHVFALRAMSAFYCSKPAVRRQGLGATARAILEAVGIDGAASLRSPLLNLYARVARV